MTWIIDTNSKRRLSAKLAAGIAISAMPRRWDVLREIGQRARLQGSLLQWRGLLSVPARGLWLDIWLRQWLLWLALLLSPAGGLPEP